MADETVTAWNGQVFDVMKPEDRPQDESMDGRTLLFETSEHGAAEPDVMPQGIIVTDIEGRWAVYAPLEMEGKIVRPRPEPDPHRRPAVNLGQVLDDLAHSGIPVSIEPLAPEHIGYVFRLGERMDIEGSADDARELALALQDHAKEHFPDSQFAAKYLRGFE